MTLTVLNNDRFIEVMTPSYYKFVDVALCLIKSAEDMNVTVTQYEMVKSVFIADRAHLNRYGRPIIYDTYHAMKHGPVPMAFFHLLKEHPSVLAKTGPVQWSRRRRGSKAFEYFAPRRPADEDEILSPSDVRELRSALETVKQLGVTKVRAATHRDRAYLEAKRRPGGAKDPMMDHALLLERSDPELIRELAFDSKQGAA